MDRNTITGFALLAALVITYFVYNNYSQSEYEKKKQADSIAYAKAHPAPIIDSTKLKAAVAVDTLEDTTTLAANAALPPAFRKDPAQTVVLENKDVALQFTTRGAYPTSATLKAYKTYGGKPLEFFHGAGNGLSLTIPIGAPAGSGATAAAKSSEISFVPQQQGPQKIDFVADLGGGKRIDLIYSLPTEGYMMQCDVRLTGIPANSLPVQWTAAAMHTERDIKTERQNIQTHFKYKGDEHDYFTVKSEGIHKTPSDKPLAWMGLRSQYFTTALISDDGFTRPDITASYKEGDSNIIAQQTATAELPIKGDGTGTLRWYIGPNHYQTLRNYNIGLDEMVPMGVGIFAFTRYINKWLILPVFNLLTGFVSNYGLIIILLTIFIKLLTSFFTYKSYLSSAKMRVLKPELDELRAKIGDDQQKMGMEQMKLYRSAGVNPMGGCLPTLFMLPFLIAMYSFIPSAIEFRQKSFLWAEDLSTYDSIASLPFSFFDHVSLFTLLMTASSLFLALYNRNMTPQDPNNPMLKYMPYIFPFVLLGVFNQMAAALTFYYFFSNLVTIAQQYIIQNFIINEDKIHRQIKEARLKPATPSKWQARIEEMQKTQTERMKATPTKGGKK
jgi:YidC/Oxa1 family membrane protein insertase